MAEPTDPVALLREAAEIVLDPPLQPATSWLTETPRNVRESLAAWLDSIATAAIADLVHGGWRVAEVRHRNRFELGVARAICEAVNRD